MQASVAPRVFEHVHDHVVANPHRDDDAIDVRPTVFVVDDDISVRESLDLLIRTTGLKRLRQPRRSCRSRTTRLRAASSST
jgi:hypothetical protein